MWGYGVKVFKEKNELVVYEGNFVHGEFHGVGSLNYSNGSYLYGNFRDGKATGRVFNYNSKLNEWYIIDD